MPGLEDDPNDDKDIPKNKNARLLQELKADQAKALEDIQERFAELHEKHAAHDEKFAAQHHLLNLHSQSLTELKHEMSMFIARIDQQIPFYSSEKKMTDIGNDIHLEPRLEDWRNISWSAIIFGALAALAISVMLHVAGLGVTASAVDTNSRASNSLALIGGVTGIWFLASTAISLFVGGFLASTLAHTYTGKRAAIYGIGVWGLSTLITMSVLVPAIVKGAGNAITAGGTVVDRAGSILQGATSVTAQAGRNAPSGILESLQRSLIGTPSGQVDQGAVQDITRLLGERVTQGEWTPQQHDQLVNDVARVAGISPDDARRRVDDVQNTINATVEQAKQKLRQAAETTRQAVATAAYSAFAAMIVGLLFAFLGAYYGEADEEHLPPFARIRYRHTVTPE